MTGGETGARPWGRMSAYGPTVVTVARRNLSSSLH